MPQLTPEQYARMEWLLGKSINAGLVPTEQDELKTLVCTGYPAAGKGSPEDIVAMGLMIVGLTEITKTR